MVLEAMHTVQQLCINSVPFSGIFKRLHTLPQTFLYNIESVNSSRLNVSASPSSDCSIYSTWERNYGTNSQLSLWMCLGFLVCQSLRPFVVCANPCAHLW